MREVNAWKVALVTPNHGSWKAIFIFEPNRHQLLAAIEGDIKDRARAWERCNRGDADTTDHCAERLRQVKNVAVYASFDFAATQLCQRITVAGAPAGTIQATRVRVFVP